MTTPSLTQRAGWTAATRAATRPARGPASARPARPMVATVPAPMRHEVTWWASQPDHPRAEGTARARMYNGGWSAPGPTVWPRQAEGSTNPGARAPRVAARGAEGGA